MAQKQYRLNLNAATFPVLVGQIGRTAFVRNESQSFIQPSYFAGNEDEKNLGIPQVLSVDNCLPSSRGFQSVFPVADVLSPYICYGKVFSTCVYQAIPIVSSGSPARNLFYFFHNNVEQAWDVVGNSFMQLNPGIGEEKKLPFSYTPYKDYWVTYAEIRGQTYIHISRYSAYKPVYYGDVDNPAFDLPILEFEGLNSNRINGICQGVNYLIAYDDDTIYYSDPSDATKFIPALGGAGSTKLLAVKGVIVACYPIPDGFIVYTTENAVAAIYTGNAQQPFVFKEIPDCPGIAHPRNVGWENSTGDHYVFTKRGLQVVSKNNSKAIFPEISDMLMHRRRQTLIFDKPYPSDNCVMYVADETDANISMDEFPEVQISYVSSRYVCISYRDNIPTNGPQADRSGPEGSAGFAFTACLVFDTALGRFGKLSYDHSCMLTQSDLISETSKRWIDFTDGSSAGADPHWDKVSLLMHMDGDNDSQIFTEETGKVFSVVGATTKITTATAKFGGASAFFDGVGSGLFIQSATSLSMDMPADFTIELFIKFQDSGTYALIDRWTTGANDNWQVVATGGKLGAYFGNSSFLSPSTYNDNQWHHFAIVRSSGTVVFYVDGAATHTVSWPHNLYVGSQLNIGYQSGGSSRYRFKGYLDEIRITKGLARYTGNFTPPSASPDSWIFDNINHISRGEAWSDYSSVAPFLQNIQSPLYCIAPWGAIIRWSADAEQLIHSVQARAMWESDFAAPNNLFTWQPKVVVGRVNLVTDRALNIYEILIEGKFSNVVDPTHHLEYGFAKVTDLQVEVFDFKEFPTKAAPLEFLPNTADNVGVSFRGERFSKKLRVVAFDPIIVISGCFNISSICVTAAPGGKR